MHDFGDYVLVSQVVRKDKIVYVSEISGFGFEDMDTAERCEQYCCSHGTHSATITRKAVYEPRIQVLG